MGLSHHAIVNTHPEAELVAVCDSSSTLLRLIKKYTGVTTFSSFDAMLKGAELDAVIISTPSSSHSSLVGEALDRGLHVFCEKPFTLDPADSDRLASVALAKGLVTQVGYHNRYVGAFREAKRLIEMGAIGHVTHAMGQAHGPVVLRPKGGTWRTRKEEGGGCLHDYAAHVIDLLSWYLGEPERVGGTELRSIFSKDTDDEVLSTLYFGGDRTAQLIANWSDESVRKMTTSVTVWGTTGRIFVDRQECQLYLRDTASVVPEGYRVGWNVKYTTELTEPVWFYLRGEEYSAQINDFIRRAQKGDLESDHDFASAARTDRIVAMVKADAETRGPTLGESLPVASKGTKRGRFARAWRELRRPGASA
jgi:predicted dehydrogenase